MSADTDNTLDPGEAYRRRVSRALWFRNPATRHRFLFAPDSPMGLFIEPLGKAGTAAFAEQIKALKAQGQPMSVGALLVDDDGHYVFCSASASAELLAKLAAWTRAQAARMPAAANLIGAGVAQLRVELANEASIAAIDAATLDVLHDDAAWQGILQATPAAVAEVLADLVPGDRLWFWLDDQSPDAGVPLLLQPVAWDPNRDRLDHLIAEVEAAGAGGDAATGSCVVVDDGRLQFRGSGLRPAMLAALASWVKAEVADAPALVRLARCQLLRTAGGRVGSVIEDDALWQGLPAAGATPGTLGEAAALLEGLAPGVDRWFWLTGAGGTPFIALADAQDDPDGVRFQQRVATLYRRFPGSFEDAILGLLRRDEASGRLLWSTEDTRVDHWPATVQRLLEQQGTRHPPLRALAGSTLVQLAGGQAARTLAC